MKLVNSILTSVAAIAVTAGLAACGGGGGGPKLSDAEFNSKATEFVKNKSKELNVELTIAKSSTKQQDYVVVYNPKIDRYQVYNVVNNDFTVVGYNGSDSEVVSVSQGSYVTRNGDQYYLYETVSEKVWDDFWDEWVYEDTDYKVTFEETSTSTKDLEALYAQSEDIILGQTSQNVQAAFGLSEERSMEVARLMTQLSQYKNKSLTTSELNMFSKELLNVSYNEWKAANQAPHSVSTEALIERAARANEISNEHMKAIIQDLF